MIFEIKKDEQIFNIEDTILIHYQPAKFRKLFEEMQTNNIAYFDNCMVELLEQTGRIFIYPNEL